jgi:dihydrofolate reductase
LKQKPSFKFCSSYLLTIPYRLYIDGGTTIQGFLKEDLIDELIITVIPILLGGGFPLFSELPKEMEFELIQSKVFLKDLIQSHFRRKR